MTRIALVSSEPIRGKTAGIGIRYLELARRLPRDGIEVVLASPAHPAEAPELPLPEGAVRRLVPGRLAEILGDVDGAVAQGQLANDLLLELPRLPVAVDLYDPWLVENLHYSDDLGFGVYENDHATWVLQLSRGDFFLTSSEEQRLYYLGFLTALGRVNPRRLAMDPTLRGLVTPVPFGVPEELPPHERLLPEPEPGVRRILFGGLYDWYDPWTLLEALEHLELGEGVRAEVLFIAHPSPESTPQRLFAAVEERCRRAGTWGTAVRALDWVPSARRYDLLREVDVLCAPHRPSLETDLSLRTRYLDALAADCPVVATEGGTLGRLLTTHGAGRTVPPRDPRALAAALTAAVSGDRFDESFRRGRRSLTAEHAWERVLEPLVAFCRAPEKDPTAEEFAFRPPTTVPPDGLAFRLRRRLRRVLGGRR